VTLPAHSLVTSIILLYAWLPANGLAAEKHARLLEIKSSTQIEGLQLDPQELEVKSEEDNGKKQDFIILKGSFTRPKWQLICQSETLTLSESGGFQIKIPLTDNQNLMDVSFQAVDGFGKTENEEITISISQDKEDAIQRKFLFTPEFGLTSINYIETGKPDYSETALTAKFSASRLVFSQSWNLGANVFFTALPLQKNPDQAARFLGINLRLGYVLPFIKSEWKVVVYGGYYFTTMFVEQNSFGFKNMTGPQLFPTLERRLNNGDSIRGYVKFSPVIGGQFNILSISNRELALGGAYVISLSNGHIMPVTLDVSRFDLVFSDSTLQSTNFSMGVGYGL
jgi:hypothetical protein